MPRRISDANGRVWEVTLGGRTTQYIRDEIVLQFRRLDDGADERRYVRFSPKGSKAPERAYEQASDALLLRLLDSSQPRWTAPAGGYRRD